MDFRLTTHPVSPTAVRMKMASCAKRYSNAPHYWDTVTRNFLCAYDDSEILLRQLVLPGHLECCTAPIIDWVRDHIPDVRFNLMFQYRPAYLAHRYPEIARSLTEGECEQASRWLAESGVCEDGRMQ